MTLLTLVVPQRQVPPQDASLLPKKETNLASATPQGVYKSLPSAQASTGSRSRTILATLHCAAACSLQNSSVTDRCRRPGPASPNQFLNQSACYCAICEAGQLLTYCLAESLKDDLVSSALLCVLLLEKYCNFVIAYRLTNL